MPNLKITKVIWEYPTPGWIKVNTDGASRGNLGRSLIGFVLRDEEGDVIYARGKEMHVVKKYKTIQTMRLKQ